MWDRLFYPVDYWLGRGRPLNPYLRGYLVDYMRRELRLRDLRVCPDKMFRDSRNGLFYEDGCDLG